MAYCTGGVNQGAYPATASASGICKFLSWRSYSESIVATALIQVALQRGTFATGGTHLTEQTNSRSPLPDSLYNYGFLSTAKVVLMSAGIWGQLGWISTPRYYYQIINGESAAVGLYPGGVNNNQDWPVMWLESEKPPFRRIHRRTTKAGWYPRLGNDSIVAHQKTGSGAFLSRQPHFDNDTLLLDPSAWRNGHDQASVWNINTATSTPANLRTRITMGMGL